LTRFKVPSADQVRTYNKFAPHLLKEAIDSWPLGTYSTKELIAKNSPHQMSARTRAFVLSAFLIVARYNRLITDEKNRFVIDEAAKVKMRRELEKVGRYQNP
jgi:hypothetical protein